MSSLDFAGKLAVVTGSSKQNGIGFATVYALAKGGADVTSLAPRYMVMLMSRRLSSITILTRTRPSLVLLRSGNLE